MNPANALKVCEQPHGAEHNEASVYGHHGSRRTCIRLFGTDTWLYDPRWEQPR